jgi:hypothetical protein
MTRSEYSWFFYLSTIFSTLPLKIVIPPNNIGYVTVVAPRYLGLYGELNSAVLVPMKASLSLEQRGMALGAYPKSRANCGAQSSDWTVTREAACPYLRPCSCTFRPRAIVGRELRNHFGNRRRHNQLFFDACCRPTILRRTVDLQNKHRPLVQYLEMSKEIIPLKIGCFQIESPAPRPYCSP